MKAKLFFLDQERRFRAEATRVRQKAKRTGNNELSARLFEYAEQLDKLEKICREIKETIARTHSLSTELQRLTARQGRE